MAADSGADRFKGQGMDSLLSSRKSSHPEGQATPGRSFTHEGMVGKWVECVAIPLLVLGACRLLVPSDPLLLSEEYPWLVLLPVLLALRHGTMAGVGTSAFLLVAWHLFYDGGTGAHAFPRGVFLGGCVTTLLVGQFRDIWGRQVQQACASNAYLGERLALLADKHFLLRASHERLEYEQLVRPATLREALLKMRSLAIGSGAGAGAASDAAPLAGAQYFLETVAQACQLEAACVYAWRHGTLSASPAASVGANVSLNPDDILIRRAVAERALTHLQSPGEQGQSWSRYIACAPIQAASGEMLGILVVSRMPFLALNTENLRFLSVVCGYYADGVCHRMVTNEVLRALPHCHDDFALEYARLVRIHRDIRIRSSIVALMFDGSEAAGRWFERVRHSVRVQDIQWAFVTAERRVAIMLMPLTAEAAAADYLRQIETDLHDEFGVDLKRAGVATRSTVIDSRRPVQTLRRFLEDCHVTP